MGETSNAMGRVRYCPKGHAFADDKLVCCPECGLPFSDTKKPEPYSKMGDGNTLKKIKEKEAKEINHNEISGATWLGLVFLCIVYGVLAIYDGSLFWHQTLISVGLPQLTNLSIDLKYFSINEAVYSLVPMSIAFLTCISYKKGRKGFAIFMTIINIAISLLVFASTLSFDSNNLISVCLALYVLSCFLILISVISPGNGKICAILCISFFVLSLLLTAYLSLHICSSGVFKPIKLIYVGTGNYDGIGPYFTIFDGRGLLNAAITEFSGAFLFPMSQDVLFFLFFYIIYIIHKKSI